MSSEKDNGLDYHTFEPWQYILVCHLLIFLSVIAAYALQQTLGLLYLGGLFKPCMAVI